MNRNNKYIVYLIFGSALLKAIVFSYYGFGLLDEGQFLHNSLKLFNGELPYKDFFAVFSPFSYYFYAYSLKLFQMSVLAPKIVSSFIFSFTPVFIYLLLKRFVSSYLALIPAILVIFMNLNIERLFFFSFIIGSFYLLQKFYETRLNKYCLGSGILLGLASMFRLDLPGTFFIGMTTGFLYFIYKNKNYKKEIVDLSLFVIGYAVFLLFLFLWLINNNIFGYFLKEGILNPIKIEKLHHIPYPSISDLYIYPISLNKLSAAYTALYGYLILIPIAVAIIYLLKNKYPLRDRIYVISLLITSLLSLPYLFGRSDLGHLLKGSFPSLLLGAYFLGNLLKPRSVLFICFVSLIVILYGFCFGQSWYWLTINNQKVSVGNQELRLNSSPLGSTLVSASTIKGSVDFITQNSQSQGDTLILPYMAGLYYLSNKTSPTRFDNVLYGYLPDINSEENFIKEVLKNNIKVIIYDPQHGPNTNLNLLKDYNPLVHQFIMDNYAIVSTTPEGWLFMIRKKND